jgi:hypothetical protein
MKPYPTEARHFKCSHNLASSSKESTGQGPDLTQSIDILLSTRSLKVVRGLQFRLAALYTGIPSSFTILLANVMAVGDHNRSLDLFEGSVS